MFRYKTNVKHAEAILMRSSGRFRPSFYSPGIFCHASVSEGELRLRVPTPLDPKPFSLQFAPPGASAPLAGDH